MPPVMRDVYSSKMVGYFEIPTAEPDRRQAIVQLAFPMAAWGNNTGIPSLMGYFMQASVTR